MAKRSFHAGDDGRVVDALVGAEDDRSRLPAGAELGEVLASTSKPSALSESGTWALPLNCEPTAPAAPKMATKAASQSPMALIR